MECFGFGKRIAVDSHSIMHISTHYRQLQWPPWSEEEKGPPRKTYDLLVRVRPQEFGR